MEITYTLQEINVAAKFILRHSKSNIFLVYGDMGSGKTTCIKAISRTLGAKEMAVSPTFNIVNEYEIPEGVIYHFDLYRLHSLQEALDMGFEDYLFEKRAYIFLEWPQLVESLFTLNYNRIYINILHGNSRHLRIE